MTVIGIGLTIAILSFAAIAKAQKPVLISPEVHPDHTVTFRFKDPGAAKVELDLEGASPLPMTKDAANVWSVTTPPLTPEIYGYSFTADGESRLDPLNSVTKPNLIWQSNAVLVPGDTPQPWEMQDLPHGELHHHFYHSIAASDNRDFFVYTPPGYNPSRRTRYPVLYLLHGFSDMAGGWTDVGKANLILDSMIAEGQAKPMIVVMPLGYGITDFASRTGLHFHDPLRNLRNYELFRQTLLEEVLPTVERTYRVSTNRRSRAIAGLSMGGAESLFVGLNALDRFSYVGAFSSGGLREDFGQTFSGLTGKEANRKLRLLWIACGTDDGLIGFNRKLIAWLKGQGMQLTAVETAGGHEWPVWRQNLIAFAGQLFKG
jgi:enterochelin esterase-like enzyme